MIKAGTDAGVFRIRTGFYLVLARLCDLMHFQLGHDQAVIYAFFPHQLIMGADFRHRMLIDDDNPTASRRVESRWAMAKVVRFCVSRPSAS